MKAEKVTEYQYPCTRCRGTGIVNYDEVMAFSREVDFRIDERHEYRGTQLMGPGPDPILCDDHLLCDTCGVDCQTWLVVVSGPEDPPDSMMRPFLSFCGETCYLESLRGLEQPELTQGLIAWETRTQVKKPAEA